MYLMVSEISETMHTSFKMDSEISEATFTVTATVSALEV